MVLSRVLSITCLVLAIPQYLSAQDAQPAAAPHEVWVYNNARPGDNAATQRVFMPYFVYPALAAQRNQVALNDQLSAAADDLGGPEDETVCKFAFNVGANEFAGIKFIPKGQDPGLHAGVDVKRELALTTSTPVSLKLRARTSSGDTAVVQFKCGGTAGNRFSDSLTFAISPRQNPTRLTDQWRDIEIPLTGKKLNSVICPLDIVVEGNANPGAAGVVVYVDDVRFEVGEAPARKPR